MSTGRRLAREAALEIAFAVEVGKRPPAEVLEEYADRDWDQDDWAFVVRLVTGMRERIAELDRLIGAHVSNWRIERMATTDRNVLRLALYEMRELGTPASVAINEAVDVAKRYGTEDSGRFVNGVLGGIYRATVGSGDGRDA